MACNILFINEDTVKKITSVAGNVPADKLCAWIPVAQDRHLKAIMGEACYAELQSEVLGGTISVKYQVLLDSYIPNVVAWWTLYEAYPSLYATITPTGIQTKSAGDYQPVDSKFIEVMKLTARNQAEMYSSDMICFLKCNTETYPCYNDCDDCTVRDNKGYNSGIIGC